MIDFSTLKGLTIPEGVVTQIADASGNVLWALQVNKPVILEVEKITSDTYAGETTYTGEQFILLDIYPKTNGTVKVTYGGLTKTITDTSGAAEPNAQQVFFGTFNGVSDEVETPASGTLTIEGKCAAFGCGSYQSSSKALDTGICGCITAVTDWGNVNIIATDNFSECTGLTNITIPDGVTSIGDSAFNRCTGLKSVDIPDSVTSIGNNAFYMCSNLNIDDNFFKRGLVSIGVSALDMSQCDDSLMEKFESITIPETVTTIGENAFRGPIVGSKNVNMFKRIVVLPTTPPTGLGAEYLCFGTVYSTFTIVVPKGCGEVYKAAEGWSAYANYIVEAS